MFYHLALDTRLHHQPHDLSYHLCFFIDIKNEKRLVHSNNNDNYDDGYQSKVWKHLFFIFFLHFRMQVNISKPELHDCNCVNYVANKSI